MYNANSEQVSQTVPSKEVWEDRRNDALYLMANKKPSGWIPKVSHMEGHKIVFEGNGTMSRPIIYT